MVVTKSAMTTKKHEAAVREMEEAVNCSLVKHCVSVCDVGLVMGDEGRGGKAGGLW